MPGRPVGGGACNIERNQQLRSVTGEIRAKSDLARDLESLISSGTGAQDPIRLVTESATAFIQWRTNGEQRRRTGDLRGRPRGQLRLDASEASDGRQEEAALQ